MEMAFRATELLDVYFGYMQGSNKNDRTLAILPEGLSL